MRKKFNHLFAGLAAIVLLLLSVNGFAQITPASGNILYVDKYVSGGNGSGDSWTNAIPELADALKWARQQYDVDTNVLNGDSLRIFVAEGSYHPLYGAADGSYTVNGNRNNAFVMVKNVQIYGGFPTGGSTFANRNWNYYPTVLNGDIGISDNNADNCYHVVVSSGYVGNALLNGFYIQEGNADTNNFITVNGHSIYSQNGGGMYLFSSSPKLRNIDIYDNMADEYGGGMYHYSSSPVLTHVSLSGNSADYSGGGMYNINASSPILTHVIIGENMVYSSGGGICNVDYSSPILTDVTLSGNSAFYGAGMYNKNNSSPKLMNVTISGNTAANDGGGMYNENHSSPILTNVSFTDNSAGYGGGMYNLTSCSPILTNVTIADNSADYYGGGMLNTDSCSPKVYNSIIWGNTAPVVANVLNTTITSTTFFFNSLVEGCGGSGSSWSSSLGIDSSGNIDADPNFDFSGEYSLQQNSPAIDAGNNTYYTSAGGNLSSDKDQAGGSRVFDYANGGIIDMGAYEYQAYPITPDANKIVYVKQIGSGREDGSSWANATGDFQGAIDAAGVEQVWVAKGTYQPGWNEYFSLKHGVRIFGGFPNNNNSATRADRDWNVNETILKGNRKSVISNYNSGLTNADTLDGFTVRDGIGMSDNGYSSGGGGIRLVKYNSPVLSNLKVINNAVSYGYGGGIFIADSSNPVLINVTISNNSSGTGAGMYNNNHSSPILTNVTISDNISTQPGGGMYNDSYSSPVLTNVAIKGNRAFSAGGGIYNANSSSPVLTNVTITDNTSNQAGGMFNFNASSPILRNVTISGNTSTGRAGGLFNYISSSPKIYNSIIWGNNSVSGGANVDNTSSTPQFYNSLIEGSGGSGSWVSTFGTNGGNNIDINPQFIDSGNYALQSSSPAIDAGNNTYYSGNLSTDKDLAGNPRLNGTYIDLGSYEYYDNLIIPDSGNILYVDKNVSGGNGSGDSWINAVPELSDALLSARQKYIADTNALNGDSLRIFVAKGTYYPLYSAADSNYNTNSGRINSFVMVKNVQLYGGFPTGGSTFANRDWASNPTILSGDIGTPNDSTDNAYHVVISSGDVDNALLDGFTIRDGNAHSNDSNYYIKVNGNYGIKSLAGGGMYIAKNSSPVLTNVTISGNSANSGGGVYIDNHSFPVLTNVTISGNFANSGGGVYNDFFVAPVLTNVTISGNFANSGGGMYNDFSVAPVLTNVTIIGNSANSGGGMYNIDNSSPVLTNVIISNNIANNDGGGMYNENTSSPILTNVTISSNMADEGGGMYSALTSLPVLRNVTISGNTANSGGGMYNYQHSSANVYNSIIWGNTAYTSDNNVRNANSTPFYYYSLIEGSGSSGGSWVSAFGTDKGGNMDVNPLFAGNGDYSLQKYSLAINAGSNTYYTGSLSSDTDWVGNPRVYDYANDGVIDMGAYEYQGYPIQPDTNNILYVDKNVSGGNNSGDSWANAIPELSDALRWARQKNQVNTNWLDNDSLRIFVAKETYYPLYSAADSNYTINSNRINSFVMVKNVQLYGGFDPANGIDTIGYARIFGDNGTILSGDIGTANDSTDNAYHVVISAGNVGNALMDGFKIQDGNTLSNSYSGYYKIVNSKSIYVRYGGGMYNFNSSPVLRNIMISNNTADNGGGIYNTNNSSPILTNVIVSDNTAEAFGGGMYNNYSSPLLTNVTISGNTTDNNGGGMFNQSSTLKIYNSIIWGNTAITSNSNIGNSSTTPEYYNSLIEGSGGSGSSWLTTYGMDKGNNIDVNPLFMGNGDYALQSISPAIDAGNNTYYSGNLSTDKDLAGSPRLSGSQIDMGAYEFQGLFITPDANNILYVDKNVSGGNGSGDSWINAVPELSDALRWARQNYIANSNWMNNDSIRIFVAKGTYYPLYSAADSNYTTNSGRINSFVMVKNVQLYGGFPIGGSTFANRDWVSNPTILSGDIGTPNDSTDNAYNVVISSGNVGNALLNGFNIQDGNAQSSINNYIKVNGNYIYIRGGGMYNSSSSPILTNVTISGNIGSSGGGMYNEYSSPKLTNVTISGNRANNGGGMRNSSSSPILMNVTISGNTATNQGGGMQNQSSSPILTNVMISDNVSNHTGGGMFNMVSSSPKLTNVTISGNTAANDGGGMYNIALASPILTNVMISGNTALNHGGGIYNASGSSPILTNVTITGNTAARKAGGMHYPSASSDTVKIYNSIIWGNTSGDSILHYETTPVFYNCIVEGSGGSSSWDPGFGTDGGNNLDCPPKFVGNGNYSLQSSSPAINAGNNTYYTNAGGNLSSDTDLIGNARVYDYANGYMIDMGAYEYQGFHDITPDANNILYVDKNVVCSDGTGSSWANAITELSDALRWARRQYLVDTNILSGDSIRIFVAKGTYHPLYSAADSIFAINGERTNSFVMVKNVQLYGGFDPANGIDTIGDARIFGDNGTILSGDIGTPNDTSDNAYSVVISSGDVDNALLDGFTIRDGNAHSNDSNYYIKVNGNYGIKSLAGGGMYIAKNSSPVLTNVTISGNSANSGGGMYIDNFSSPVLINVTIIGNSANSGGGVYNDFFVTPVLTNVTISGNTANSGGGMYNDYNVAPVLTNVTIIGNSANSGGGMYNIDNSSPVLTNVMISGNTAINKGGAIYSRSFSSPKLTNVTISSNMADEGGGMYSALTSLPVLRNVTISGNTANSGGGMYNYQYSNANVYNSIIWGNTAYTSDNNVRNANSTPFYYYSLIEGSGSSGGSWVSAFGTDKGGNMDVNPLFAGNGDYSLQKYSLAINAGSNTYYTGSLSSDTDWIGNPRVYDYANSGVIDMGAYEYQGYPIQPDTNNILYVDKNVSGGNNSGDSWANAIPELSDALRWARQKNQVNTNWLNNDSLRIFVAKETYYPLYSAADSTFITNGDRNNAFVMLKNVQLYGGFYPANGIDTIGDTRIFGSRGTILSGDIGIVSDSTDNAYHVVISSGNIGNALLDGFNVEDGNANLNNNSYITVNGNGIRFRDGGGIYNNFSSPKLTNVTISSNTGVQSGGLFNDYAAPILTNVTISGNKATIGAGMHSTNSSSPILRNVTITGNTGGGIHSSSFSSPTLMNVTISNNTGGGMYNDNSSPILTNVVISGNTINSRGGGMYNFSSSPILTNVTISGNTADQGGGMLNFTSFPKIYNSIISENKARFDDNIYNLSSAMPEYYYSLIEGSGGSQSWVSAFGVDSGHNIDANPLFVANGDYSLRAGSPATDAGSNAYYTNAGGNLFSDTDLAGNSRVYDYANGGIIDMGAYEYIGSNIIASTNAPVCEEDTLKLSAAGGIAYKWTGPKGFTSTNKDIVFPSAHMDHYGVFKVTIFTSSKDSVVKSFPIVINLKPRLRLLNDTAVCEGETVYVGATGGISYNWTGPNGFSATTSTFALPKVSSLQSGAYHVITSNSQCHDTGMFRLTVKAAPDVMISSNSPVCVGDTIKLSSAGGTNYSWTGPNGFSSTQQNPVISNANANMAGIYSVTVSNANNCSSKKTLTVDIKPLANPSASNSGSVCEQGTLQLFAVGGNGYSWTGPNGFSSNVQNPIINNVSAAMAGAYTVTVNRTGFCDASTTTHVIVNNKPTAVATSNGPLCEGQTLILNGSRSSSNSSGGLSYQWIGPDNFSSTQSNPVIQNVSKLVHQGIYTLIVSNGSCSDTTDIDVSINSSPVIIAGSNGPVCIGDTLNLYASSGTSYSWMGPNGFRSNKQNPEIPSATSSDAGTYTVTVSNTQGCAGRGSVTVNVNNLPTVTASASSPACEGGSLNLSASSGSTYSWTGPNNFSSTQQNATINNLTLSASGTYSVKIRDNHGCFNTDSVNVRVNVGPDVMVTSNSPLCQGDVLYLTATGGIDYEWTGPKYFSSKVSSPKIDNVTISNSGTYSVTVTDQNGCTNTGSVNVTVNPALTPTASSSGPVCEGTTLNLFATGGTNYSWTGPNGFYSNQQNPVINNVSNNNVGIYTVTVSKADFCDASTTINVAINNKPTAVATSNGPLCEGQTLILNGSRSSSNSSGGLSYQWSGPDNFSSTQSNPVIQNVSKLVHQGIYTLIVFSGNCSDTTDIDVTINSSPVIIAGSNGSVCIGDTLKLYASSGTNYSWTGPNGFRSNKQNPEIPSVALNNAGTYTVAVSNAQGCAGRGSVTVNVNSLPTVTASASQACEGESLNLSVSSGSTYQWTGPNNFSSNQQNVTINNVTSSANGVYSVRVRDNRGCFNTDSVKVNIKERPEITVTANSPICQGDALYLKATGGGGYQWTGPNNFDSKVSSPKIDNVTSNNSGTYSVTVTGRNGCARTGSVNVTVIPGLTATASNNGPVCEGTTLNLYATGGTNYSWTGPNGFTSNQQNPVIDANIRDYGRYTVTVSDSNGCERTAFTNVVVNLKPNAYAGANSPICEGQVLYLQGRGGMNYQWTGPNNFSSTQPSPIIGNAQTSMAGQYRVIAGNSYGCTDTAYVSVSLNSGPSVTASYNAPVSQGGVLILSASGNASSYRWSGPNRFLSASQTSMLYNVQPKSAGVYTVTATDAEGCSSKSSVTVVINKNQLRAAKGEPKSIIEHPELLLYPNPANNVVTVACKDEEPMTTVQVYNALGQIVYSGDAEGATKYQLQVNGYASGLYNVKVILDDGTQLHSKFQVAK